MACVFSEPQFTPAVVQSVMRGSDVAKGELDPLGVQLKQNLAVTLLFSTIWRIVLSNA